MTFTKAAALLVLLCAAAAPSIAIAGVLITQDAPPPVAPTAAPTAAPTKAPVSPPPGAAGNPPPATSTSPPPAAATSPPPATAPTTSLAPPPGPVTGCTTGNYLSGGKCNKCVTNGITSAKTTRGRFVCYLPTTLSSKSTACSAAVLPVFVRAYTDVFKTRPCIIATGKHREVAILLPTVSNAPLTHFLNRGSYIKASLRLNNSIPPRKDSKGRVLYQVRTVGATPKIAVFFDDKYGTMHSKKGGTVRIAGVLRRGGSLLPYCFQGYLDVCA